MATETSPGGKNARVRHRTNQSLPAALIQLSRLCGKVGITGRCYEHATNLMRTATTSAFMTGRVMTHCVAAVALMACREYATGITVDQVADAANMDRRSLWRTYNKLCAVVGSNPPAPTPEVLVLKICEAAGIGEAARSEAMGLVSSLAGEATDGRRPATVAATALYASCIKTGERVSLNGIAAAAGVGSSTICELRKGLAARNLKP